VNKDELKNFDGKDGRPAYVGYKGNIYDVTNSKMWRSGTHMNRHFAGEDLTDQMSVAPHADDLMSRFKIIDSLEKTKNVDVKLEKMEKMREFYRKFHPHPVMIHYPMALFFFAALMQFFFLLFKEPGFESAAFYSYFVSVLSAYPATLSGIFSWWINYQKILTPTFKIKLYFSILLLFLGSVGLILRILFPEISSTGNYLSLIYNILIFLCLPLIIAIGYHGGKITWPS